MVEEDLERLDTELELLLSIYPEEVSYHTQRREVVYTTPTSSLTLRLPDSYPANGSPEVTAAGTSAKESTRVDLRDRISKSIQALPEGEEALDAIIASFHEIVHELQQQSPSDEADVEGIGSGGMPDSSSNGQEMKTVVIWLHHLLNTSKRKLALASSLPVISGVSKPGYPGVLVFSGPADRVGEHVEELRRQNWQAFQVRLEEDEEWVFEHGAQVVEVESMKDVVREIESAKREAFLEAMRIK